MVRTGQRARSDSWVGLNGLAGLVGLSSSAGPISSPLLAFTLLQLQLKFADALFEFIDVPHLWRSETKGSREMAHRPRAPATAMASGSGSAWLMCMLT